MKWENDKCLDNFELRKSHTVLIIMMTGSIMQKMMEKLDSFWKYKKSNTTDANLGTITIIVILNYTFEKSSMTENLARVGFS